MTPPEGLAAKRPPTWASWQSHGYVAPDAEAVQHVWSRGRLRVLSSLIHAEFRGQLRWQWLVTVSASGPRGRQRATDVELSRALRDFGMERAEEDNHQPGVSRAFFLLCDAKPDDPAVCECKETEEVIVEPDGFAWSKARGADADEARAAEASRQLLGRVLPP